MQNQSAQIQTVNTRTASDTLAQIAVVVSFIATLTLNTLAVTLPLFGRSTKDISDSYPSFFTPAGLTFSIWSILYLSQLAFTVFQALPAQAATSSIHKIRWPIVAANLFNATWIIAWHGLVVWASMLLMIGLLLSLIVAYNRLEIGVRQASSEIESWLVRLPVSLYLGWITVATVANAVSLLINFGWSDTGLVGRISAALLVLVAAGIGAAFSLNRRDIGYNLVLLWAFLGIYLARPGEPLVVAGVIAGAFVVLAGILISRLPGRAFPLSRT
jgi:translocator protein